MKTSLPGIESIPEAWNIDFVNQKFNFKSNKKYLKTYRLISLFFEATIVFWCFIIVSLVGIVYNIDISFLIIIGLLSILTYIFSPKYRYWLRNNIAWGLVKRKEIKKIKVSSIYNKNLKIYFKNYYLDCIRYGDFMKYLEKVNCYQIFKSSIWCAEFIFKDNPKEGYMLLKYY